MRTTPAARRVPTGEAYQRSFTPNCICRASRVAVACPKLRGSGASTIGMAFYKNVQVAGRVRLQPR